MADTAAFCVDCLFPRVPTRQYALSLPYALRFKIRYHGIIGPATKDRAKVVPTPPAPSAPDAAGAEAADADKAGEGETREIDLSSTMPSFAWSASWNTRATRRDSISMT
jgi:hypothetical protein